MRRRQPGKPLKFETNCGAGSQAAYAAIGLKLERLPLPDFHCGVGSKAAYAAIGLKIERMPVPDFVW